jgi:hypothetical protein
MRGSTATLAVDVASAVPLSWDRRLVGAVPEDPAEGGGRLSDSVAALIEDQKRAWPLLRAGYEALAQVQTRPLDVRGSRVVLQHNAGRLRNTTADVAAAAAGERPCFLCVASLPPEERGIAFGDELVVLCNPFPILERHLSIAHRAHVPQRLAGQVGLLLALAESLGPDFFVLYNGPRCGASAPDHLHFQACSRALLPIAADAGAGRAVLTPEDCGRSVLVLRDPGRDRMRAWIEEAVGALPVPDEHPEPMINLICLAEASGFSAYLFPRAKHRPEAFHAPGDERLVVSPGAIDMAGVIVVPERRDFERLDAARVEAIYREVTLPAPLLQRAAARIGA